MPISDKTEEDTYQALKRQPYLDLRYKIRAMPADEWRKLSRVEQEQWFANHGWTFSEYIATFLKSHYQSVDI